ncbi:MAG TPA: HAMP domain-containing sensor histidine kinase [Thermoguttaceae bacterium]|nr:HAMP domain-containing sensor histidine kinase [Thermoguttaceae bacterium]
MNKKRRYRTSTGRDLQSWPVLLSLLVVVLAPTVCVLWFMGRAMRNERLAVRQTLADAYRGHLALTQERLQRHWQHKAEALRQIAQDRMGPAVFAQCVHAGLADSVICYDQHGQRTYPNTPPPAVQDPADESAPWATARRLEQLGTDLPAAADAYGRIAEQASDMNEVAQALQAQVRCLVRAGRREEAVRLVTDTLSAEKYRDAVDRQGRLIVPNAQLMALQLHADRTDAVFRETADRLTQRLNDYDAPTPAAPQRRFLMRQLHELLPEQPLPTLAAEDMAARFVEAHPSPRRDGVLRSSQLPDVWQFGSADGRVLALFSTEMVLAEMHRVIAEATLPEAVSVELNAPADESGDEDVFLSLPAGEPLPGWRLSLSLTDRNRFDAAADERIASYLWTGMLVIGGMSLLALLIGRAFRRQVRLTRLKNDLVATVSHELKTPLSSIRLLVDTLLDTETPDPKTVREYLQLVAKENMRLSRLIDNFLTFSRMERNKHAFEFVPQDPARLIASAVESAGERFQTAECRLRVDVAPDLPQISADADAMVTVLLNLLDNAYKYTNDDKRIELSATAEDGNVCFVVKDNGLGLTRSATRKVFKRFYQVDQHLSRSQDGCGLGLSIVRFVVDAHGGTVRVDSRPGGGSTFTVTIPGIPK